MKSIVRAALPRRVRAHVILGGPLRGARIVTSWHDYPAAILGTTESALLHWLQSNVRAGETWLDVGAHYGYIAIALCRLVGDTGRVFAFEPVLTTAAHLQRTREINRLYQLTIVPFGLDSNNVLSKLESTVERGMATHMDTRKEKTDIYVIGLDPLWQYICGDEPRVHGVKIDVQGMEDHTLRGMINVLERWRPKLIIEFHRGVDRDQLMGQIAGLGYDGVGRPLGPQQDSRDLLPDQSYVFLPAPAR